MKSRIMKTLLPAFMLTLIWALTAVAQNPRLEIDSIDRLFPKAIETVDVRVEGALLQVAAKFLKSDKADEAAAKEVISMLKGVYVKGVEFEKEGEFTDADIEAIRNQLRAPGWERVVGVRSKRDGQNVDVYLMLNNGLIEGVGVLVSEPKELYIINVVGPLDPEKISQLRGQFGIPGNLDFDFGGSRRRGGDDK